MRHDSGESMSATISAAHAETIRGILAAELDCTAPFTAERLGGLTNFNYLVTAGDLRAVFRLPGDGTEDLVDRAVECDITHAASEIGVDSELLYFDPVTGIKTMRYIDGAQTMHVDTMHERENVVAVARLLRKLHSDAAAVDFRFDVFEMIPQYEELILRNETIDWEGYDELRTALFALRERMNAGDVVLCHCDPLCENFVKSADDDRMYLIDWEYGGMNDPLWDVADVIIEAGFDRDMRDLFQESYFGRPATQDEDERVTINIVLIDFLWALWGKQRSYYDHTLDEYGPERFERAKRNFASLGYATGDKAPASAQG